MNTIRFLLPLLSTAAVLLVKPSRGNDAYGGFEVDDEAKYLAAFDEIVRASHETPLPSSLTMACKAKGQRTLTEVVIASSVDAAGAASKCDASSLCIVAQGAKLRLDGNLNVGALVVQGELEWAQDAPEQYLCAGYIVAEKSGKIVIDMSESSASAFVYVKNNGAEHGALGKRAFGGFAAADDDFPVVHVFGRKMARTWSLLSEPAAAGSARIRLLHDPSSMGWQTGDRIVIAPTERGSSGIADARTIASIQPNAITLSSPTTRSFEASYFSGRGNAVAKASEVINLSRNRVTITGDDFETVSCDSSLSGNTPAGCGCSSRRTKCTLGLHTAMAFGGEIKVHYARIEKCGQRGIMGKYCLHFHRMSNASTSSFVGNAIEFSHQRGIVVHGTHLATVAENVMSDVRGANIYIEDGNEMYNLLSYNVAICPWKLNTNMGGCTIPGTDNADADTSVNQAGLWALGFVNHVIGNRFANHFNGMFYQAGFAGGVGRGGAQGKLCTTDQTLGRLEGNTFHGSQRFGTYFLDSNFPKRTDQSIISDGMVADRSTCNAFKPDGTENGLSVAISSNFDYDNGFVGAYDLGDISYVDHTSVDNTNLIYWKTTKNFNDGCSAHISNGYYSGGQMAMPDHGAVIVEKTIFDGDVVFEANHHCNIGVTGVLCQPVYVFSEVVWQVTSNRRFYFQSIANTNGGMFVLAPPEEANPSGNIFPAGFCALASKSYGYLLDFGSSVCVTAASLNLANRFDDGILCKRTLRPLRVWTRNLNGATAKALVVKVYRKSDGQLIATHTQPFFHIGGTRKQGYALPIIPGRDLEYQLSLQGGGDLGTDWPIEFSENVFGNRWKHDEINLIVAGRPPCGIVSSAHDRRYIYADPENYLLDAAWGRGACTSFPDAPAIDCEAAPPLEMNNCNGMCDRDCGPNGFCNCGTFQCMCKPGFYGPDCSSDVCDSNCGENGHCIARYLGGTLQPAENACVCESPWVGAQCDKNPCTGVTCSGHGTCVAVDENNHKCQCDGGYAGDACASTCIGVCGVSAFPHGCASSSGNKRLFCEVGGKGCLYKNSGDAVPNPQQWCCYKNCAGVASPTLPPSTSQPSTSATSSPTVESPPTRSPTAAPSPSPMTTLSPTRSNERDCEAPYPDHKECKGRMDWMLQNWDKVAWTQDYVNAGVDGSRCSIQIYLFSEGYCPNPVKPTNPPTEKQSTMQPTTHPAKDSTPNPTAAPENGEKSSLWIAGAAGGGVVLAVAVAAVVVRSKRKAWYAKRKEKDHEIMLSVYEPHPIKAGNVAGV